MKRVAVLFLLLPMLLFGGLAHAALPSVEQVQAEVKAGRYGEAESMMREVVAAKPESARAHYVYAEVLARTGKRDEALRQVAEARRLDPAINFADKARFEQFERTLQSGGRGANGSAYAGPGTGTIAGPDGTTTRAAPSTEPVRRSDAVPARRAEAERGSGGVPGWLLLAGVVLAGVVVWRLMAARRSSAARPMAAMPQAGGYPGAPGAARLPGAPGAPGGVANPGYGYGPGVQPGAAPGRGPGMMGVGLGVAGGLAAGMLAERMLHGNEAQAATNNPPQGDAAAAGGAGLSPGVFDDASGADALRDQPVDFGTGGSDWDSGGGDSFDAGGGGDEGW